MRKGGITSALLAALAMSGAGLVGHSQTNTRVLIADETTRVSNQLERGTQQAPGDTKSDRLGTGAWMRRSRAPVGKRYSASVRQHQRHAAKARNKRKA